MNSNMIYRVDPETDETFQYTFTVFTPTFNRAHTLERVYDSLCLQTFRDFEWLVVDDGSADGTRNLIDEWQVIADFPIRYIYQENQGKHIAINRGVGNARGMFFLTFDSDDSCVPEALERFVYHWCAIPLEQRPGFSAVTALCVDSDGRVVGDSYPEEPLDSDSLETYYKFGISGEKWGFQRTTVLKKYLFPEGVKKSYVPEGIVWMQISRQYKTRYVNDRLRIYHTELVSISNRTNRNNAAGGYLAYQQALNDHLDYFHFAPFVFFKAAISYILSSLYAGYSLNEQRKALKNRLARFLWWCAVPAGIGLYWLKY